MTTPPLWCSDSKYSVRAYDDDVSVPRERAGQHPTVRHRSFYVTSTAGTTDRSGLASIQKNGQSANGHSTNGHRLADELDQARLLIALRGIRAGDFGVRDCWYALGRVQHPQPGAHVIAERGSVA